MLTNILNKKKYFKYSEIIILMFNFIVSVYFISSKLSIDFSNFSNSIEKIIDSLDNWYLIILIIVSPLLLNEILFNNKNNIKFKIFVLNFSIFEIINYIKLILSYYVLSNIHSYYDFFDVKNINIDLEILLPIFYIFFFIFLLLDAKNNNVNQIISRKDFIKSSLIFIYFGIIFIAYIIINCFLFKKNINNFEILIYSNFKYFNITIFILIFIAISLINFIFMSIVNIFKPIIQINTINYNNKNKMYNLGIKIPYAYSLIIIPLLSIIDYNFWLYTHIKNININIFNVYRIANIFINANIIGLIILNVMYLKKYNQNLDKNEKLFLYMFFSILFANICGFISVSILINNKNKIKGNKNELYLQ